MRAAFAIFAIEQDERDRHDGLYVTLAPRVRAWRQRRAKWELQERSIAGAVHVLATRIGSAPLVVGRVPFERADFDSRLYELRAEGRERVYALNQEIRCPACARPSTS